MHLSKMTMALLAIGAVTTHAQVANPIAAPVVGPMWKVGAHAGVSMMGDVEDGGLVYGVQGQRKISERFGVEVSGTWLTDSASASDVSMDMDVTSLGVAGVYTVPIDAKWSGYALAGVSLNMADFSIDLGVDYDELRQYGFDVSADADADPALGFLFGVGSAYQVTPNCSLFAEFRYTVLSLDVDVSASASYMGYSESASASGELDYDFAVVKLGANYCF
jgi:opacity protein-like surface antigen